MYDFYKKMIQIVVFCVNCRSENIIERDITPLYLCLDCGNDFNDESIPYVIDQYNQNKTLNVFKKIIFDKNDPVSSVLLIFLLMFPIILGFFI